MCTRLHVCLSARGCGCIHVWILPYFSLRLVVSNFFNDKSLSNPLTLVHKMPQAIVQSCAEVNGINLEELEGPSGSFDEALSDDDGPKDRNPNSTSRSAKTSRFFTDGSPGTLEVGGASTSDDVGAGSGPEGFGNGTRREDADGAGLMSSGRKKRVRFSEGPQAEVIPPRFFLASFACLHKLRYELCPLTDIRK